MGYEITSCFTSTLSKVTTLLMKATWGGDPKYRTRTIVSKRLPSLTDTLLTPLLHYLAHT
jgi:hypothetical protein